MRKLALPENLIKTIIDDPAKLSYPASLNLSEEQGFFILDNGYTKGFRLVFILNASLSALATVTSILLIKHKNLTREDDEKFKQEARCQKHKDEEKSETDKECDTDMKKLEEPSTPKETFNEPRSASSRHKQGDKVWLAKSALLLCFIFLYIFWMDCDIDVVWNPCNILKPHSGSGNCRYTQKYTKEQTTYLIQLRLYWRSLPSSKQMIGSNNQQISKHLQRGSCNVQFTASDLVPVNWNLWNRYP